MLYNVDLVNLLFKKTIRGGGGGTQNASFYFCGLECSGCQWVGGGSLEQKVLFRAD